MSYTSKSLELRNKGLEIKKKTENIHDLNPNTERLVTLALELLTSFWTKDVVSTENAITAMNDLMVDIDLQLAARARSAGTPPSGSACARSSGTSASNSKDIVKETHSNKPTDAKIRNNTSGSKAIPPASISTEQEIQQLLQDIRANASLGNDKNPFKDSNPDEVEIVLGMFMQAKDPNDRRNLLRALSVMVHGNEPSPDLVKGYVDGLTKLGQENPILEVIIKRTTMQMAAAKTEVVAAPKAEVAEPCEKAKRQRQTRDVSGSAKRCSGSDSGKNRRASKRTSNDRRCSSSQASESRNRRSESRSGTSRRRRSKSSSGASRRRRSESRSGASRRRQSESRSGASRRRRSESHSGASRRRRSESHSGASRRRRSESRSSASGNQRSRRDTRRRSG